MTEPKSTFEALRSAMLAHAKGLDKVIDQDDHLYLNTRYIQKNKKPLFFGAVQVKKGGLSYHLMPLYTHPELLTDVSALLKKKMSGKSCFKLNASDDALIKELVVLTKAAYEAYRKAGYV
jgi:hypothetical protein